MHRNRYFKIILLFLIFFISNKGITQPLFPNSVVSNDIDFILDTDTDVFLSLTFIGLADKEMPGSESGELFDEDTFIFEATFSVGPSLEIWCHSSFLTVEAAQEYAEKLCPRLGKLPLLHRSPLTHVVIHNGDGGAFAEIEGNFFILYSENMDERISNNDLEETVFHEAVHASIQEVYQDDPAWTDAQDADPEFVTVYAASLPDLEDMAESALFAYTFITHPGRLSAEIETWLTTNIPNRLVFFCSIYPSCTSSSLSESTANELTLFPNPVINTLTVTMTDVVEGSQINIYSITGVLVKSVTAFNGANTIPIDELENGVYVLVAAGYEPVKVVKE